MMIESHHFNQYIVGKIKTRLPDSKGALLNLFYDGAVATQDLTLLHTIEKFGFVQMDAVGNYRCNVPVFTKEHIDKVVNISIPHSERLLRASRGIFARCPRSDRLAVFLIYASLILDLFALAYFEHAGLISYPHTDGVGSRFYYYIEEHHPSTLYLLNSTCRVSGRRLTFVSFGNVSAKRNTIERFIADLDLWPESQFLPYIYALVSWPFKGMVCHAEDMLLSLQETPSSRPEQSALLSILEDMGYVKRKGDSIILDVTYIDPILYSSLHPTILKLKKSFLSVVSDIADEVHTDRGRNLNKTHFKQDIISVWHYIMGIHNIKLLSMLGDNKSALKFEHGYCKFLVDNTVLADILRL